jgi:hypothetical protein
MTCFVAYLFALSVLHAWLPSELPARSRSQRARVTSVPVLSSSYMDKLKQQAAAANQDGQLERERASRRNSEAAYEAEIVAKMRSKPPPPLPPPSGLTRDMLRNAERISSPVARAEDTLLRASRECAGLAPENCLAVLDAAIEVALDSGMSSEAPVLRACRALRDTLQLAAAQEKEARDAAAASDTAAGLGARSRAAEAEAAREAEARKLAAKLDSLFAAYDDELED